MYSEILYLRYHSHINDDAYSIKHIFMCDIVTVQKRYDMLYISSGMGL